MKMASIVRLCLTAVAVGAIVSSISLGIWKGGTPGPGLFPLVSGVLLVMAIAATTWERGWSVEATQDVEISRFIGYAVAIAGFVGLLIVVGTLPAIFAFLFFVIAVIERLRWPYALMMASATTGASWAVFERLLAVPLPAGIWS